MYHILELIIGVTGEEEKSYITVRNYITGKT